MNVLRFVLTGMALVLTQPAFAGDAPAEQTKLLFQQIAGEMGKLGPEFRAKNGGKAKLRYADHLFEVIRSLPKDMVLCVATKKADGTHFLISKPNPDSLLFYHFWQKPDGKWETTPLTNPEAATAAMEATYVGMTHEVITVLPPRIFAQGLVPEQILAALGPTQAYLDSLVEE